MDADAALEIAMRLHERLLKRRHEADELDDYYEGKHGLKFASREWSEFHKDRYVGFSDNWCGVIPDAANERLRVTSITVDGDSAATKGLWRAWLDADMQAKSSQGFLQSMTAKRSFVTVWGDSDDQPVVSWEHPSQVIVDAHPLTGERRYSLKSYVDGDEFMTLDDGASLWKWRRAASQLVEADGVVTSGGIVIPAATAKRMVIGGGWVPYQPSGDDAWPVPNPLGEVATVEIPNRPRLKRGPLSDIAGARAMQDAINMLWAWLFAAADHASMPARVVMGQEPPKLPKLDSEGRKIGDLPVDIKELQKGRILWLTGQDAKIGQWDAASLETFTKVIEIAIGHISSQVRVPAHYFVANTGLSNINGETLTATETPLVKKVEEFQLFTSSPLRDVARLMAKVMGDRVADSLTPESIQWANPAIRSEAQLADALSKKKAIGYPLEYLMELDGMGPQDIERVLEMKRKEASDPELMALADRLNGADEI